MPRASSRRRPTSCAAPWRRSVGPARSTSSRTISSRAWSATTTSRDFAERCFKQIEGFGEYGFPESHAASFAILVYDSSWVKHYYPEVFAAALLNSQPMGFYAPAQLVRDAREHDVEVRPPDVNASDWDCTLEPEPHQSLRPASRLAPGRGPRRGRRQAPGRAPHRALSRPGRPVAALRPHQAPDRGAGPRRCLRLAGPLAPRRAVGGARFLRCASAAARRPTEVRDLEPAVALPSLTLGEQVVDDYAAISMSLRSHPLTLLRPRFSERGVAPTEVLKDRQERRFLHLGRAGPGAPAAGHRLGRGVRHHRGRMRHRQPRGLAQGLRRPSPHRHGLAPARRARPRAARGAGDPSRRRAALGLVGRARPPSPTSTTSTWPAAAATRSAPIRATAACPLVCPCLKPTRPAIVRAKAHRPSRVMTAAASCSTGPRSRSPRGISTDLTQVTRSRHS